MAYLGQHQCRAELYALFFLFLIFKTYTYYVLIMYMYYERNTSGLQHRPNPRLLEKVFRPARDVLKEIDSQSNFLYTCDFYCLFMDTTCFIVGF